MMVAGKRIFLIDSAGALLTALILTFVLAPNQTVFGMPRNALYLLAGIACLFSLYSVTCFLLAKQHWKPMLKVIAMANLLYCFLSIFLLIRFYDRITLWGVLYFCIEVIVIIILGRMEWQNSK